MSTFVLVHGGWAGGWIWEKVAPVLRARGHQVVTPDLPGRGADLTPLEQLGLGQFVDTLASELDAVDEPVVLVGHSSGGLVTTQTAEDRPDAVARLVYVAAFLPLDGETGLELMQSDPAGIAPSLEFSDDGTAVRLKSEAVGPVLFHDCPARDRDHFLTRAVDEPAALPVTPVRLTPERFGTVPVTYVECRQDRALSPELQRRMHARLGDVSVVSLSTGHMPMYAAPGDLAEVLCAQAAA